MFYYKPTYNCVSIQIHTLMTHNIPVISLCDRNKCREYFFHLLNRWTKRKDVFDSSAVVIWAGTGTWAPDSRPLFFPLDSCGASWSWLSVCVFLLPAPAPLSSQGRVSWFGDLPRYLFSLFLFVPLVSLKQNLLDRKIISGGRRHTSSCCVPKPEFPNIVYWSFQSGVLETALLDILLL